MVVGPSAGKHANGGYGTKSVKTLKKNGGCGAKRGKTCKRWLGYQGRENKQNGGCARENKQTMITVPSTGKHANGGLRCQARETHENSGCGAKRGKHKQTVHAKRGKKGPVPVKKMCNSY